MTTVHLYFETVDENVEACTEALINRNYSTGLEAFADLGSKWKAIYEKQDPDHLKIKNAYFDLAAKYFAVNPERITSIMLEHHDLLKQRENEEADAFCEASMQRLKKLTDEMFAEAPKCTSETAEQYVTGNDAYAQIFVRTGNMELLDKVVTCSDGLCGVDKALRSLLGYEVIFSSASFTSGLAALPPEDPKKVFAGNFKDKLMRYGALSMDADERKLFGLIANRQEDVLDAMEPEGYNNVWQAIQAGPA